MENRERKRLSTIRRIVLIGHENSGSRRLFEALTHEFDVEFFVIITGGLYYRRSWLGSVWKLIKESSILFCFMRMMSLYYYKLKGDTLAVRCRQAGIPVYATNDVNGSDTLAAIAEFQPDLIISLYTMHIYRDDILRLSKLGAITSHPSLIPEYRGLEVFFWALANGEKETGVSVFQLTERIDNGMIYNREKITIDPEWSAEDLYYIVTEVGAKLLVRTVLEIDSRTTKPIPPASGGSYYPMPTREAVYRFLRAGKRFF